MRLNLSEDFLQLLEQLSYLDHELCTEVMPELTEVISHARSEGLSPDEISEVVRSRVSTLSFQGKIHEGEQADMIDRFMRKLPSELLNA